jgi:hypothetical protein
MRSCTLCTATIPDGGIARHTRGSAKSTVSRLAFPGLVKRRLPLLQPAQDDTGDPPRPPWQWVGFGAAAVVATWLPLSLLVGAAAARLLSGVSDGAALGRAALVISGAYALELGAGALAGGYLVGRWGPSGVGVREGALAGLAAAVGLAVLIVASSGAAKGAAASMLFVALVAPLAAAWGARIGVRRRARGGLPPLD